MHLLQNGVIHVFTDLMSHALILFWLLGMILLLLLTTYIRKSILAKLTPVRNAAQLHRVRLYLGSLILVIITIMIYWFIDVHFIDLPDPVFPFTFYILIFTVLFGVQQTLLTAVLSFVLIEYYLFEPRYDLNPQDHVVSSFFTLIGLFAGLYIGYKLWYYQQQLVKRAEQLNFLIKARDQFAAIAAHDLKSPITTIKLYAQRVQREQDTKKTSKLIRQMVQTIDRETTKLTTMVDSLLDFSKLQSGKFTLQLEELNLVHLLAERTKTMNMLYPDHIFEYHSRLRNAAIYADRISVDRIISNLLTNAAKYSPVKSKIVIQLNKEGRQYTVSVIDKGDGIAEDAQKALFEPFYQVSSGKQGLGLGLYIVKALVDLHKGKIWVESKIGKGSTFYVRLPAYERVKREA